ncbi:hypothetical protein A11A3_09150 [Alcanivorax hongdengensis A-11-3]|uniref:Putative Flp pilus-assembly TadG-like N-terminal domain-containing protein n=1 Tax=Alcanivorax hongdengensis A-11-3 TaxID=1177179 RepID=L0WEX2_9GAMM|nr:pilus assembly protein TadG-related protein [Alcanivorax hongdengensis]EKF74355.1 hypothetical protein A11A3_09150 [Alcanivorax hongdengensis A-11-3]
MRQFGIARQSGAIALATPFVILLILALTVFLLDGARLYAAKREMQSIVNAAATAAADNGQTCNSMGDSPTLSDIQTRAETAATQRGWDGKGTLTASTGLVSTVEGGPDDGQQEFEARPVLQSNAVAIRYSRPHNISLLLGGLGTITLDATAVARKELNAGISVESYTASLDSTQSALLNLVIGGILQQDGGLHLNGVNFDSLRGTLVDVEDLVAGLTGGTAAGDILGSDVTADAVLSVLKSTSDATGVAAIALDQVVDAAVGTNTNVALADIVNVLGDGEIPKGAKIPALDVIISTVFNVGKALPSTIHLDLADSSALGSLLSSLGVGAATLDLEIDQAPGFVFAPARQDENGNWYGKAKSADITLTLDLGLNVSVLGLASLTTSLPLTLDTGSAEVTLVGARCAAGTTNQVTLDTQVKRSLLSLQTNASVDINAILLGKLASVSVTADSGSYGGGAEYVELGPIMLNDPQPYAIEQGDSGAALDDALTGLLSDLDLNITSQVPLLNVVFGSVTGLLNGVTQTLVPILQSVSQQILGPLLDALGLSVGNARITVASKVQSPVVLLEDVDF